MMGVGLLLNNYWLRSEDFMKVLTKYFFSSIWSPSVLLLLHSILGRFAYREVSYLIYYNMMISILSLPLMTWLLLY